MKINNIIMGLIGIMVCAIMVGGALLPAVGSAIDDERVLINNNVSESNYSIVKNPIPSDYTATIVYDVNTDVLTVDGEVIIKGTDNNSMILGSKLGIYLRASEKSYFTNESVSRTPFPTDATKITVSVVGDDVNIKSDGTGAVDVDVIGNTWLAIPDNEGSYKMAHQPTSYDSTLRYYINSIDQIYGATTLSTNSTGFISFHGSEGYLGVTDETVNMILDSTPDNAYVDVVSFNAFNGYYIDPAKFPSVSSKVAPAYILVPDHIYGHTEENWVISSLYQTIPIIAVAGLVMAGIYVFISRK